MAEVFLSHLRASYEIEHHFVEELLRFPVRLHLPIKGCNLCMGPSLPARADNCFKAALGFHWIAIGSNEGTGGPIYHHPDLPQVRLRMLHDPPSHFTNAVWRISVRRDEWLEIWLVVPLCFGPSCSSSSVSSSV